MSNYYNPNAAGNQRARDYFASAEFIANKADSKAASIALDADVAFHSARCDAKRIQVHMSDEGSGCVFCAGTGHIAKYSHIHGGECYRCNGTGIER